MMNMRQKIFRLSICMLVFSFFSTSIALGDMLLRYSKENPKVKEEITGISGQLGGYSLRVAENVIGKWEVISKSLARNPDMELQFLYFRTNGVVEVSYKLISEGEARQFIGLYDVIQKATKGSGSPPNIVIKSHNSSDEHIQVLVEVRIGSCNIFPSSLAVLRFRDPDGNNCFFKPVGVSAEHMSKLLGRTSAKELETRRKHAEALKAKRVRAVDPELTQEMCAKIKEGNLSEYEKNLAILHLMNEGDSTCVPLLIELLTNSDTSLHIRQTAIRALGKIGDKKAVPVLVNILEQSVEGNIQDEDEVESRIRRKAINALGYIGDPSALSVLKKVAKSDKEYQSVRGSAERAIRKIEKKKGVKKGASL